MIKVVAPALRILLDRLIDYAGMFPPASLSRDAAVDNFKSYKSSEHAWMLRSLVINASGLPHLPAELDGWLAVLSDADEPRAGVIESKRIIQAQRPVYCEVPIQDLDQVKQCGCFAKIRTGGVKPEAIPSVADVAAFIIACAERKLPLKATAGLHHPLRSQQALTYSAGAPRAVMHGFLNVFMAAAFAWSGERDIEPILAETDADAFSFGESAKWRHLSLSPEQIRSARLEFAHSFGSCSFEEPIQDLKSIGLL